MSCGQHGGRAQAHTGGAPLRSDVGWPIYKLKRGFLSASMNYAFPAAVSVYGTQVGSLAAVRNANDKDRSVLLLLLWTVFPPRKGNLLWSYGQGSREMGHRLRPKVLGKGPACLLYLVISPG